jgi:hypothetical protein
MVKEVVRVAVTNNFNFTDNEIEQIKNFETINPEKSFFLNSNILTENLEKINSLKNKVVITINPNLTETFDQIKDKLFLINRKKIAFVRIKYVPENKNILDLIYKISELKYKIVLTIQRFNTKKTLLQYTKKEYYSFERSRFRLKTENVKQLEDILKTLNQKVYICDKKDKGCRSCNLCSKLTIGKILPIKSLNLSSSGICKFNCPDCYAKYMQKMLLKWNTNQISFDVISKNSKQKK